MAETKVRIMREALSLMHGVDSEDDIRARIQGRFGSAVDSVFVLLENGVATAMFAHEDVPDEMILAELILERTNA